MKQQHHARWRRSRGGTGRRRRTVMAGAGLMGARIAGCAWSFLLHHDMARPDSSRRRGCNARDAQGCHDDAAIMPHMTRKFMYES
jgi:hypothetical protein